jgi:hypothetical protein
MTPLLDSLEILFLIIAALGAWWCFRRSAYEVDQGPYAVKKWRLGLPTFGAAIAACVYAVLAVLIVLVSVVLAWNWFIGGVHVHSRAYPWQFWTILTFGVIFLVLSVLLRGFFLGLVWLCSLTVVVWLAATTPWFWNEYRLGADHYLWIMPLTVSLSFLVTGLVFVLLTMSFLRPVSTLVLAVLLYECVKHESWWWLVWIKWLLELAFWPVVAVAVVGLALYFLRRPIGRVLARLAARIAVIIVVLLLLLTFLAEAWAAAFDHDEDNDNDTTTTQTEHALPYVSAQLRSQRWLTVRFEANGDTLDENHSFHYDWNFGDGTMGVGERTTHTYAKPGVYKVYVVATDQQTGQTSPEPGGSIDGTPDLKVQVPLPGEHSPAAAGCQTWKMSTGTPKNGNWLKHGVKEISNAKSMTQKEANHAVDVWMSMVKRNTATLSTAAAFFAKHKGIEPASLDDAHGCANKRAQRVAQETAIALGRYQASFAQAPADATNSGTRGGHVYVYNRPGIGGNRRAIKLTNPRGEVIWILGRCGNLASHMKPPVKTEKPPRGAPMPPQQPHPARHVQRRHTTTTTTTTVTHHHRRPQHHVSVCPPGASPGPLYYWANCRWHKRHTSTDYKRNRSPFTSSPTDNTTRKRYTRSTPGTTSAPSNTKTHQHEEEATPKGSNSGTKTGSGTTTGGDSTGDGAHEVTNDPEDVGGGSGNTGGTFDVG